jgi:hypothetical protein
MGQRNFIYAALREELMNDALAERMGDFTSWRYQVDLASQRIVMMSDSGEVTAKVHLLATVAVEPPTLMWGHSDVLARFPDATRLARKVYEYGLEHHEAELTTPQVPYTLPRDEDPEAVIVDVAHDIGCAAMTIFGDDYYYYGSSFRSGSYAALLLEDLSVAVPPITLDYLQPRLGDYDYLLWVDDPVWSLEGLVELMPGRSLELENGDDGLRHVCVTDDAGRTLSGPLPEPYIG